MPIDRPYVPFSQREGLVQLPTQLKLGQVSAELRRLIDYYIGLEIEREESFGVSGGYFDGSWKRLAKDFHVLFLKKNATTYKNSSYDFRRLVETVCTKAKFGQLFDFVEFFIMHSASSQELKNDLTSAFVAARAAYRVVDAEIVAIGTEQQAEAFEAAVAAAEAAEAIAARKHLVSAGKELRLSNWAGSVRESIHAVESMVLKFAPEAKTLGAALSVLERDGHLHGSLKSAFGKLYGYSSDEEGVRHALVFGDVAHVDEADALFMLGACASFVSYLIARNVRERT